MFKKFRNLFLVAGIALAFTACSDDDGGSTGGGTDPIADTEVVVSANITESTTWTAGNEYILTQRVYVTNGATLTIEPGVVVKGASGTGTNSKALIVDRGAKIMAEGSATTPIIFTSVADDLTSDQVLSGDIVGGLDAGVSGQWGGLIVLGRAPIEASADELQIEGIPTSEPALYGGNDPADNSGVLKYISIRHGGTNIGAGNEINGLTLGGVGNGTIIENVEIVANADDGIEWFGGTVNITNAIVWNNGDDAYDTDQGWAGTLDNFVAANPGGSGLELDGAEDDDSGTSRHTLTNGWISNVGGNTADMDDDSRVNLDKILFLDINVDSDTGAPLNTFASANAENVTFTDVFVDVASGTELADYFSDGIPSGVQVGTTNTVDVSAFTGGWSWAGSTLF